MSIRRIVALVILGVFALGAVGCSLFAKKAAIVNGDPIYMSDVDTQLAMYGGRNMSAAQSKAFEKQKPKLTKQILDLLIDQKIYEQQAAKMGIKITDQAVETEVNKTIKRFPSRKDFDKAINDAKMTMDDLRKYTKTRLLTAQVENKVVGTITVTDAETKAYYDKNLTQFKEPEEVKVAHILVGTEDEAKAIITEVVAGADFAEEAKTKSQDPASKASGGDIGYVQRGVKEPSFEQAAFSLGVGEMTTTPVKTSVGWEIIKVIERIPEKQRTYEESKTGIEQTLMAQKRRTKLKIWLDGVKKKSTIKKYI